MNLQFPSAKRIKGDACKILPSLPSQSIHLIVTSPPYDDLRTYGRTGPKFNFAQLAGELYRVLVPGGVLCWNVGDSVVKGSETLTSMRQALHFVDVVGFWMHDTMIWHKPNFSNPESVRYHQVFEYVFVLSKGKPRTFNPIMDKPNATAGRIGALGVNSYTKRDGSKSTRTKYITQEFGKRGNVWFGNTRGQEEFCEQLKHPAMMPKWLVRDLILSWSNPGDIVLDPMAGSGTTGREAIENGRSVILIEISDEYIPLIDQALTTTVGLPLANL